MASFLKQRLVGAIVLISLGIIFIPMLLTGRGDLSGDQPQSNVPPKPAYEIEAPVVLPMEDRDKGQPTMQRVTDDEPASQAKQAGTSENEIRHADTDSSVDTDSKSDKIASAKPLTTPSVGPKDTAPDDGKQEAATQPASEPQTMDKQETSAEQAPEPEKPAAKTPAQVAKAVDSPPATKASQKPVVSGWIVQLGSFAVEKNALQLRDKLRNNGHASFVETYQHDGKTRYRVRVGPEQTRELANQLKTRLKQETQLSGLVMSFPE